MKKFLSVILALMIAMMCFTTAFATEVEGDPTQGNDNPAETPAEGEGEEEEEVEEPTDKEDASDIIDGEGDGEASGEGSVVTDHGEIDHTEYWKDGVLYEKQPSCKKNPYIGRVFYEDGWYQDMVLETPHKWSEWTTTATCTEPGVKTRYCLVCGIVEEEEDPALGHIWSSEDVPGESFNPEHPELWGEIIENADCTKEGLVQEYCVRCGETRNTRVIEKPAHKFDVMVVDPKPICVKDDKEEKGFRVIDGQYHWECRFCGAKYDEEVAKEVIYYPITLEEYQDLVDYTYDGHDWDAWVTEIPVTCEKDGRQVRWCKRCGYEEHRTVPALKHNNWHALELIEEHLFDCFHRYNTYKCTLCGKIFYGWWDRYEINFTEVPAEEIKAGTTDNMQPTESHFYITDPEDERYADLVVEEVEPTCVDPGKIVLKCLYHDEVDGHKEEEGDDYKVIPLDALGHDWIGWVCEHKIGEEGNEYNHWVNTCRRCGDTKDFNGTYNPEPCTDDKHDFEVVDTVAATCTEDGEQFVICKLCGAEDTVVLPATGHSWLKDGVVTEPTCTEAGYTTYTCATCGETMTEDGDAAIGHDYTSEVVIEASCANGGIDGKILYTCKNCGDLYTEIVPAPEHVEEVIPAVEAEVGKAGSTEGVKCSVCGEILVAPEEIPAIIENVYELDLADVEKGGTTSGTGSVKLVEGNQEIEQLYARVTWVYTLSNGDSFAYCAMKEVKSIEEALTFNMTSPQLPYGATLDTVQVALVTDANADSAGSYDPIDCASK